MRFRWLQAVSPWLLSLAFVNGAFGLTQEEEKESGRRRPSMADAIEGIELADDPIGAPLTLPETSGLDALDPETRAAALAAFREFYNYRVAGFEHRKKVFAWQLGSSKVIFYVVILLVLSGIYFSGVQFHLAMRSQARAAKDGGESKSAVAALDTELEASLEGVKVSSPVLGVIILVISFLFFYMYLITVHPITDTF